MLWRFFGGFSIFLIFNLLTGHLSHDYIADLYSKSSGKKIKTFKEFNSQGYTRLVQEMISYANYVDQERRNTADPAAVPTKVNFDNGPGNLPLLPSEVIGIKGVEVAQHAKEIIRSYFLRHYRKFSPESIGIVNSPSIKNLPPVMKIPRLLGQPLDRTRPISLIPAVCLMGLLFRTQVEWVRM